MSVLVSERRDRAESSTHSAGRGNISPLRSFPVLSLYDKKMTLDYSLERNVRVWRQVLQRWWDQIVNGMNLQQYSSDTHQPC